MSIKQAIDEVSRRIDVQPQQEIRIMRQERCECECDKLRDEYEGGVIRL
ncbi:hypothetical protein [Vulcanisaeta souniana]|nr:hypothetical protein [Vulcanisaeta souniana]